MYKVYTNSLAYFNDNLHYFRVDILDYRWDFKELGECGCTLQGIKALALAIL